MNHKLRIMNKNNNIKKIGKGGLKGINILLTIAVLIILPIVVFTLISSKTDKLGGFQSFVVLTGSMEPNVSVGSVIFTKPNTSYDVGDVIAFSQEGKTITHRIVESQIKSSNVEYSTKGDANDSKDSDPVSSSNIIGKQIFTIPYLGKLIVFLSTIQGFLLFIVTPIFVFVLFELWNIKKELEKSIEKKLVEKMKTETNFGFR